MGQLMYFPIMNWRISSCILHWCRWQIYPRGNITVFRIYVQVTETLLMSKTVLYNPQCISFVHDYTIWFSFPNFHINITKCVRMPLSHSCFIVAQIFLQKNITYIREKIGSDHVLFPLYRHSDIWLHDKTW